MSEIKVRLGSENKIRVIPSIGAASLSALNDVDTSNLGNGYVLVYDNNTNKWTATNILTPGEEQNLIINGGNF
jgi:hypothetical protein